MASTVSHFVSNGSAKQNPRVVVSGGCIEI